MTGDQPSVPAMSRHHPSAIADVGGVGLIQPLAAEQPAVGGPVVVQRARRSAGVAVTDGARAGRPRRAHRRRRAPDRSPQQAPRRPAAAAGRLWRAVGAPGPAANIARRCQPSTRRSSGRPRPAPSAPVSLDGASSLSSLQRAPRSPGGLVGAGVCLVLAALSAAVLPTVPSYDPWSWIVWGREVSDPHLSFVVSGGPSWKPLPFLFTTLWGLLRRRRADPVGVTARWSAGCSAWWPPWRLASRLAGGGSRGRFAGAAVAVAGVHRSPRTGSTTSSTAPPRSS